VAAAVLIVAAAVLIVAAAMDDTPFGDESCRAVVLLVQLELALFAGNTKGREYLTSLLVVM